MIIVNNKRGKRRKKDNDKFWFFNWNNTISFQKLISILKLRKKRKKFFKNNVKSYKNQRFLKNKIIIWLEISLYNNCFRMIPIIINRNT